MSEPCPACGRGVYCVCKAKETITTGATIPSHFEIKPKEHEPDCAYLDTVFPDACDCWMDDDPPNIPDDEAAAREILRAVDPVCNFTPGRIVPILRRLREGWTSDLDGMASTRIEELEEQRDSAEALLLETRAPLPSHWNERRDALLRERGKL